MSFRILLATSQGRIERKHGEPMLRIGRGAGSDLRFDDPTVALEHAVLRNEPEGWWLSDLGSASGTYVNGQPIDTAKLNVGDRIEIGNSRIVIETPDGEEVVLSVGEAIDDLPSAPSEAVDWLSAFGLRRGLLNKSFLSLLAIVIALFAMIMIPALEHYEAYQPGTLAAPHREAAIGCFQCHQPWKGVSTTACASCHSSSPLEPAATTTTPASRLATPAPDHHADLLGDSPACVSCHQEHDGLERLQSTVRASETSSRRFALGRFARTGCVDCHGDLQLAMTVQAVYANSITAFVENHPDFTVTVAAPTKPGNETASETGNEPGTESRPLRRLPVDSPAVRTADPGSIAFSHRGHLESRLIAANPDWQPLTCVDCHQLESPDPRNPRLGGDLRAVSYELHCQECHALSFDDRFPDLTAPHDTPARVQAQLFSEYQNRRPDPPSGQPPRLVARLLRLQRGDAALGISEARNLSAVYAAADLYEEKCSTCHQMNLDEVLEAGPEQAIAPQVAPTGWQESFQIHARFAHGPHVDLNGSPNCLDCHAGIETSTQAQALHLPGIGSCTPCHGSAEPLPQMTTSVVSAPTSCDTCHRYHSSPIDPRTGSQTTNRLARWSE